MKLVIAATPDVALPTIERIKSTKHQIIRIITQPDKPAGRGKVLTATPIGQKYKSEKPINESEIQELLKDSDLLITIGFGRLLSEKTLATPKFGGINLHFSLLPKWRGAAPVQRCLEAGEEITGVTVFQMDNGMDTGDIWVQREFKVPDNFYSHELFDSLADIGADAVIETLEKIESGVHAKKQEGSSSLAAKISSEELKVDWSKSAATIRNKIRGLGPATYSTFRGEKIRILKAELSTEKLAVAEIALKNKKLYVGTSDSALEITRLTPAGKNSMSGLDFANGARLISGEKFA